MNPQGSTIKPLVNLLNIDKASLEQRTLMAELNESFFESLTAGVRLVADSGQGLGRRLLNRLNQLDERYLARVFTRNQQQQSDMKRLFEELIIADQLAKMNGGFGDRINPAFNGDQHGDVVITLSPTDDHMTPKGLAPVGYVNGTAAADLNLLLPQGTEYIKSKSM